MKSPPRRVSPDAESDGPVSVGAHPDEQLYRRGIAPQILLEHVNNTVPFVLHQPLTRLVQEQGADANRIPHIHTLRELAESLSRGQMPVLSHVQYYRLCVSAHHATIASMVPTDVDNQIRFKLWPPGLALDQVRSLVDIVLESLGWDCRIVSTRWLACPETGEVLSGHQGEWLTTAVAAYGATRRKDPETAAHIHAQIVAELAREASIYRACKRARDGIGLLKAATLIAHNLGDLDRVLDLWKISAPDPLAIDAHKLGHEGADRFKGTFFEAGALNKAFMAVENHRYFALREPRCLRREAAYLAPVAPFLDGWGETLGRHEGLSAEEVGEVTVALVEGWEWLNKNPGGPMGYARALAGIQSTFPGGLSALEDVMPARALKTLKGGPLRTLCAVPKARFEGQWAQMALNFKVKS